MAQTVILSIHLLLKVAVAKVLSQLRWAVQEEHTQATVVAMVETAVTAMRQQMLAEEVAQVGTPVMEAQVERPTVQAEVVLVVAVVVAVVADLAIQLAAVEELEYLV
jgi:hypothetical protein